MSGILKDLGQYDKQRVDAVFEELFPNWSANEDAFDVMALTEAYHKYKREYVRQLIFTPKLENPSKFLSK